jgi:hypothetical protein
MWTLALPAPLGIVLLGAIVGFGIWWAWSLTSGVRFRPVFLGLATAGYFVLFVLLETGDWLGIGNVAPLDFLLLAIAFAPMYVHTIRKTRVAQGHAGETAYRASPVVAGLWLIIFLLEIYLQVEILGVIQIGNFLTITGFPGIPPTPLTMIPNPYQFVLASVDALFALGTGLTMGYSAGIFTTVGRYRYRLRGVRQKGVPGGHPTYSESHFR